MKGFLEYRDGNSFFHKLNPLTKLFMAFLLCAVCFLSENIIFILVIICLNLIIGLISGVFQLTCNLLKGLLKLSILLFVIQVLFIRRGNILFTLPLINLGITDEGVLFSLLLVLRLATATLPLAIMLSVTQLNDLTNAMSDKLKIPYKYVFSIITAIRFIPVFSSEMADIIETQTARGVAFDTKNIFKKLKLIVPMCVPLLLSSVRKIDVCTLSSELKGFNLRKSGSSSKKYSFTIKDLTVLLGSICLFGLTLYIHICR